MIMAPTLFGDNYKFVKFLGPSIRKRDNKNLKTTKDISLSGNHWSYVRILTYRTWPVVRSRKVGTNEGDRFPGPAPSTSPSRGSKMGLVDFVIWCAKPFTFPSNFKK